MSPPRPIAAAYFDLDETLMRGFSALLSGVYLFRTGRLGLAPVLHSFRHLLSYRLQRADYTEILRDGIAPWVGSDRESLRAISAECFEQVVRPRLYREGISLVNTLRERGIRVYLLSSTSPFILREVARFLRCDGCLATEFAFVDGRLTDRLVGEPVFGEGKRRAAERHAREAGLTLLDCAFYTDSASDLPTLTHVGHPVAVNPDRVLRREAERRGWPILRFRETLGHGSP